MPSGNVMTIPFDEDQVDSSNFGINITHEINRTSVWRSMSGSDKNSSRKRRSRNHHTHQQTKGQIHLEQRHHHGDDCHTIEESPKENSEEDDEVEEDFGIQLSFSSNEKLDKK